jgi:hypothetical protein
MSKIFEVLDIDNQTIFKGDYDECVEYAEDIFSAPSFSIVGLIVYNEEGEVEALIRDVRSEIEYKK